jgi:exo-1,4-beta-D-glucosaminidase
MRFGLAGGDGGRGRLSVEENRARLRSVVLALTLAVVLLTATPASADLTTLGLGGWQVLSSTYATQSGARISRPSYPTRSWLHVRPDDAGAVGTEIEALIQNGRCTDVFYSNRMQSCFGYMGRIGADTVPRFSVPWWFRTQFTLHLLPSEHEQLVINGVVGQADVWVNGREVASQATVQGDYTRYSFDITRLVRSGANALALKVYPNDPDTMFTVDNVDWTQIPPDNDTGIQFPIQVHTSGPLALSDAHVVEHNASDLSSSALTLKAQVTNGAGTVQTGEVTADVSPPSGGNIQVQQVVTLPPKSTRTVAFAPPEYPQLLIVHPDLWWPYQLGGQPLYGLTMSLSQSGLAPDTDSETFGIRTITTRLVGASAIAPAGSREFLVNGRPLMFRGGGWSENLFLHYSAADTAAEIALMKNLGLNGIRTEGKQMPDDFYEQMDRAGLLIDAGYECCDAWQLPGNGAGVTNHDYDVLALSAKTIGQNLRNHPSVLNFSWSDNNPIPRQESVSLKGFRQADFQDPLIASAEYKSSAQLGPSGEKEGPYDWVPPSYWYDRTHYDPGDPSRTDIGGAWAFNSEASSGDTVPTLDSIRRFMSPFEQRQLWQNPNYNQYHLNYEPALPGPENGGYSFGTLHDLDQAIKSRYGPWSGLSQYVEEAQVQNYETGRAQFEAYIDNSTDATAPSTGLDYWQLNKGWPTLLWDLYNEDFDEAGSYFGAQEANRPLHVLYAYGDGTVSVDNFSRQSVSGLSVQANVYSLAGKLLDQERVDGLTVASGQILQHLLHPHVPATTAPPTPAQTYFIELLLREADGTAIDRNVYWLSTQTDVVNWGATVGNPQATMSQYGNLRELRSLGRAGVSVSATTAAQSGPDGADTVTNVTITNDSTKPTVAFFLRADVRRGSRSGAPAHGDNEVLPVFWSGNDVTLWPGESETLSASYRRADLRGASPVVSVSGWNQPVVNVPAP